MTRLTFYGITFAALIGMIAGLLELIYQQVCDADPALLGRRWQRRGA
jgi:hypothetical protein